MKLPTNADVWRGSSASRQASRGTQVGWSASNPGETDIHGWRRRLGCVRRWPRPRQLVTGDGGRWREAGSDDAVGGPGGLPEPRRRRAGGCDALGGATAGSAFAATQRRESREASGAGNRSTGGDPTTGEACDSSVASHRLACLPLFRPTCSCASSISATSRKVGVRPARSASRLAACVLRVQPAARQRPRLVGTTARVPWPHLLKASRLPRPISRIRPVAGRRWRKTRDLAPPIARTPGARSPARSLRAKRKKAAPGRGRHGNADRAPARVRAQERPRRSAAPTEAAAERIRRPERSRSRPAKAQRIASATA